MSKNKENRNIYKTTVPFLEFNFRQYSKKATLIGIAFAQYIEQIDRFLFFERWVYHCFEPNKKWAIENFVNQEKELEPHQTTKHLQEYYRKLFGWEEQEKIIAELLFMMIVNRYTIYIRDIVGQCINITELEQKQSRKFDLSSFPKIKAFYKDFLSIPLFTTTEEEKFVEQILAIRNLIVHSYNDIPDKFVTKFHNWKDLGCIKQDSDLLIIQLDFPSLNKLGNFLVKSVADIDARLSEKFNIAFYYFDEEDMPKNAISPTLVEDEDLLGNLE